MRDDWLFSQVFFFFNRRERWQTLAGIQCQALHQEDACCASESVLITSIIQRKHCPLNLFYTSPPGKTPSFIPHSCSYHFPQLCLKYIILVFFFWKCLQLLLTKLHAHHLLSETDENPLQMVDTGEALSKWSSKLNLDFTLLGHESDAACRPHLFVYTDEYSRSKHTGMAGKPFPWGKPISMRTWVKL